MSCWNMHVSQVWMRPTVVELHRQRSSVHACVTKGEINKTTAGKASGRGGVRTAMAVVAAVQFVLHCERNRGVRIDQ